MGQFKLEDIAGIKVENEIVCLECSTKEEMTNLIQDDIIFGEDVDDSEDFCFCDRCKKRILAQ